VPATGDAASLPVLVDEFGIEDDDAAETETYAISNL
jgi:hypothetical protein